MSKKPTACFIIFSSTYDFCSMLNTAFVHNGVTQCPSQMAKQGLPCTCPVKAGTYTLNPDVWTMPELSPILSLLSVVSIIGSQGSRYDNHGSIMLRVLKDLATIFQLYRGSQIYSCWKLKYSATVNKYAIDLHCREIYNLHELQKQVEKRVFCELF